MTNTAIMPNFQEERKMLRFGQQTQPIGKMNNQMGFTLIEVMICVVILAVGILAVAAMQTSAINGNNRARSFSEATTLAQSFIETIIRLPFDPTEGGTVIPPPGTLDLQDVLGANGGTGGLNDGLLSNTAADFTLANIDSNGNIVPNGRYTIDFNFADNVAAPSTKTIRLIVTWRDARGTPFPDGVRRRRAVFDFIKPLTTI